MTPFRLDPDKFPGRTKIQFTTSASMPHNIYRACVLSGIVSNTVYIQLAVCEALSRDLGIPIEDLLAELPEPRRPAKGLFPRDSVMTGPANTIEEVR